MPILFATVLIDLIGFGIIIPILPFMAPALGASNFDIALIIAIYSLFGGLVGPFWGKLSDKLGRKPVLLICLGGAALSYVLLAFSTTLTMLYISRALAGFMAGNFGVASAMIAASQSISSCVEQSASVSLRNSSCTTWMRPSAIGVAQLKMMWRMPDGYSMSSRRQNGMNHLLR